MGLEARKTCAHEGCHRESCVTTGIKQASRETRESQPVHVLWRERNAPDCQKASAEKVAKSGQDTPGVYANEHPDHEPQNC
jgi:hypothetical protein